MNATAPDRQWPYGVAWITFPLTVLIGLNTGAQSLPTSNGTGSEINQFTLSNLAYRPLAQHARVGTDPPASVAVTAGEDIDYIKNVLKLTVTELAQYVGVSRQAVYDWRSGGPIKSHNISKLENLMGATNVIAAAGFAVTAMQIRRKLPGGRTMLEAIASGGSGPDSAQTLLEMLRRDSVARDALSRQYSGRRAKPSGRLGAGMAGLRDSG